MRGRKNGRGTRPTKTEQRGKGAPKLTQVETAATASIPAAEIPATSELAASTAAAAAAPARSPRHERPPSPAPTGLAALFEAVLKRFKIAVHLIMLAPLYVLASVCLGLAGAPSLALIHFTWSATLTQSLPLRYAALGVSIAMGYFIFGFSLMFIVAAANRVLVGRLRPWRGAYYSAYCLWWYIHNGLLYLVRYTFLEFVTPTPLNLVFYRLMGMRIGEDSQINSTNISDASLIELGNRVTIGGSATIVAHYGMGGFLVVAPVKIGDGATIGLKATVMGGVEIGEKAKIMPNSVVLPRTKIPAGETWGGVPARRIDLKKDAA